MHTVLKTPVSPLVSLESQPSAVLLQGTRLYVGTQDGQLASYKISEDQTSASLQNSCHHSKSSTLQLGFVKELHSLLVLPSDGNLLLLDAHSLELQTSFSQHTKGQASIFALHTSVRPATDAEPAAIMTSLAITARRRLILFRWKDGEWQDPSELQLPHQARSLTYMTPSTLVLGFSDGTYSKANIRDPSNLTLSDLPIGELFKKKPMGQSTTSSLGGLGGLASRTSGYMGLGGKLAKNLVLSAAKGELLALKEGQGLLLPAEGPAKEVHFDAEPDHLLIVPPFTVAALPAPSLQVYSAASMELLQTLECSEPVKILASGTSLKMPILAVVKNDVYLYAMVPYPDQISDLLSSGQYSAALALVNGIEDPILADRPAQLRKIQALVALKQLKAGLSEQAIDAFIDLEVNPAKVVGLFEEKISGKLWLGDSAEEVFGGRSKGTVLESRAQEERASQEEEADKDVSDNASVKSAASSSLWHSRRSAGKGAAVPSPLRQQHSSHASASSTSAGLLQDVTKREAQQLRQSVEVLLRYLADRRQKVNKALASLPHKERPSTSDHLPNASAEELLAVPDGPMTSLNPCQLHRAAQVVDTALFKCYLLVRPTLLGSLCRLDNWCEAEEVEDLLMSAKRYNELLDLYSGKGMHSKAIELLKKMSEEEPEASPKEKVEPAVTYLQKLGPRHFDLIRDVSKWVFSLDEDSGIQLFTADLEEVEQLPRHAVLKHLQSINQRVQCVYLEHIIHVLGEEGPEYHEALAELYLEAALKGDDNEPQRRLVHFLETSKQYRPNRLLGKLTKEALPEVRAILLGRLGQHEKALKIYVYRMQDYRKAEEYCNSHADVVGLFDTLLRLLLQPEQKGTEPLYGPALELLARQSQHFSPATVMNILPPLLPVADVQRYLSNASKNQAAQKVSTKLRREVNHARLDQLMRASVLVQEQRVKVTDSTLCPGCHKRIGNSVIAVHQPEGVVTHYRCQPPSSSSTP